MRQSMTRHKKQVEKDSGHYAVMAAGPVHHPYVKFFRGRRPDEMLRAIRHHNFDDVGIHAMWWCHCEEDAKRLKAAIEAYVKAHFNPARGNGFYLMRDPALEIDLAFAAGHRASGVGCFTTDQREIWLQAQAKARAEREFHIAGRMAG